MTVAHLRLAPAGETMFHSRAPFFQVPLDARRAHVTAPAEESKRGKLPVSPGPFHTYKIGPKVGA
jgi:hypothetical protein